MQESDNQNRETTPADTGGKGGLLEYEPQTKGDLALVERAIRLRWPIREKARRPIIRKLERLAIDSDDPRTVIRAATAIMQADRINMEQEERDNPTAKQHVHTGVVGVEHDVRVTIIEDSDWYGNAQHFPAAALEAPGGGLIEPGPVQGGLCGPAVGQNGNGAAGHH